MLLLCKQNEELYMLELHMRNSEQRRAAAAQFLRLASLRPTSSTFALLNELSGLTKEELRFQEDDEEEETSPRPTSSSSTMSTATFLSLLEASSSISSFGSRPNSSKSGDFHYQSDYDYEDDEDYSEYIYRTAPSSAQSNREPVRPMETTDSILRPATAICLMRLGKPDLDSIPYFSLPKTNTHSRQLSFQDLINEFDDLDIQPTAPLKTKVSFNLGNLDTESSVDEIMIFKSLSRPHTGNVIKEVVKHEKIVKPSTAGRTKKAGISSKSPTTKTGNSEERIPSIIRLYSRNPSVEIQEFKSSFPKTSIETVRPKTQTRTKSRAASCKKAVKKKKICELSTCRKKLSLTSGFICRCGLTFCSTHRYTDRHACSFDYKAHGRNELIKSNPLMSSTRISQI